MTTTDYLIHLVLSVILIVGGYQFYFWCQRNSPVAPREFRLALDERLPYWPSWVWIYSFLYYPLIVCVNLVTSSAREFTHMATSYLVLLSLQMAFFLAFPVATPEHWRHYNQRRTVAERFLALVQKFDARSNSFPSMHVSVAMLTALHLAPHTGPLAFAFPVLIALSCIFTKQHYVVDLPAGALLGWGTYRACARLLLA
jgi:membrane-associated phospholipid phosphatase